MFHCLLLYGIIDWILEKIAVRNGGGLVRWARVRIQWGGVVASVRLRTMGEEGQAFTQITGNSHTATGRLNVLIMLATNNQVELSNLTIFSWIAPCFY